MMDATLGPPRSSLDYRVIHPRHSSRQVPGDRQGPRMRRQCAVTSAADTQRQRIRHCYRHPSLLYCSSLPKRCTQRWMMSLTLYPTPIAVDTAWKITPRPGGPTHVSPVTYTTRQHCARAWSPTLSGTKLSGLRTLRNRLARRTSALIRSSPSAFCLAAPNRGFVRAPSASLSCRSSGKDLWRKAFSVATESFQSFWYFGTRYTNRGYPARTLRSSNR